MLAFPNAPRPRPYKAATNDFMSWKNWQEARAWTWAVTIETCECKWANLINLQTKPSYNVLCDTRAGDRPSVGDRPTVQKRLGFWCPSCIFLPTLLTLWLNHAKPQPATRPGHRLCLSSLAQCDREHLGATWPLPWLLHRISPRKMWPQCGNRLFLLAQEKHAQNSKIENHTCTKGVLLSPELAKNNLTATSKRP